MEDLNNIIGKNICEYRKKANLTQLELAEKINYSDKSISKWEKGDGVPDIYVLKSLADIFNITVNDLISDDGGKKKKIPMSEGKKNIIILLSIILVWFIAVFIYVILKWAIPTKRCWLAFIVALPVTFIVALVLCSIWKKKIYGLFCTSGLVWSLIVTFCVSFKIDKSWLLYLAGIPMQVMVILWYVFIIDDRKKRKEL